MKQNGQTATISKTVSEMMFPDKNSDTVLFEERRKKGMHSLQVVMDTIAYAQNIQIRLLRPKELLALEKNIKLLINGDKSKFDIINIIRRAVFGDAWKDNKVSYDFLESLHKPQTLERAHQWLFGLMAGQEVQKPDEIGTDWIKAMVALLPHVERKIFLTSLSNPLPAHALCRMQNTWALYILLDLWKRMRTGGDYSGDIEGKIIHDTFGIPGFVGRPLPKFQMPDENGVMYEYVMLIGPAFEISERHHDKQNCHKNYKNAFRRFNEGLNKAGFEVELHSTVNEREIDDALNSRIEFPADEVVLRSNNALRTLKFLLSLAIDANAPTPFEYENGQTYIFSRTEWYTISVLCIWLMRWENMLAPDCSLGEKLLLGWDTRQIGIIVEFLGSEAGQISWKGYIVRYDKNQDWDEQFFGVKPVKEKIEAIERNEEKRGDRIDRVEILYNRVKERQNAAWSRQIAAVHNLLIRHGSANIEWGRDDIEAEDPKRGDPTIRAGVAGHLLKGFGPQICKYLADITRADLADIFWLDYSQTPPRLLHAGGFARTIPHIVASDEIIRKFDAWAWGTEVGAPAKMQRNSTSQAYRVVATGVEDCHPRHQYPKPNDANVNLDNDEEHEFYVDCYGDFKPEDAMALPLLVNRRVVGVLLIGGLVPRQFNRRLLTPLQSVASIVATTMYQENQLWQMRRLNSLFAKSDISFSYKQTGADSNVLKGVVRCLTNIFLCPVAQIWLCDESLPFQFKLRGYNWPSPTQKNGEIAIFDYRPLARRENLPLNPKWDGFISLAVDLWYGQVENLKDKRLSQFVQGRYDPDKFPITQNYSAHAAHRGMAMLGLDFLPKEALSPDASPQMLRREQIFKKNKMRDIMAFALVQPIDEDNWKIVGAVSLHDHGGDFPDRNVPWDSGWCPVVAHMQTYLPHLFTQAEVLTNPMIAVQSYYLHAGRAVTVAMKDSALNMFNCLGKVLSPDSNFRQNIENLAENNREGNLFIGSPKLLSDAWEAVDKLRKIDWMKNLDQIAEMMHQHKNIANVTSSVAVANEKFNIFNEIERICSGFHGHFKASSIYYTNNILASLELRLKLKQFRLVLYDLIHNASKYTMKNGIFEISWDERSRVLTLRNEGKYNPEIDKPELLTQYQVRGSTSVGGGSQKMKNKRDNKGTGTGLWGCKVLCGQIGIGFYFDVIPLKGTNAWYVAKLKFKKNMLVSLIPKADHGLF